MDSPNPKRPHIEVSSSVQNPNSLHIASIRNANSWPLPPELTIKVFSMLDTKSLMRAMACCATFDKFRFEPLCYSHINLTTSASANYIDNEVVCEMILRAGKELRSLKLGNVDRQANESYNLVLLEGSCLEPLSYNDGFIGKCLRSIHLYNVIISRSDKQYIDSLSACSNITDLKIVGSWSKKITSLATVLVQPRRLNVTNTDWFKLHDTIVHNIVECSRKLKYMNISKNSKIKGCFLSMESTHSWKDSILETLILRDCSSLEEEEVSQFLNSISTQNFRFIRHIDISNNPGMESDSGTRTINPMFPLEKLKEARPHVMFVVDFSPAPTSSSESSSESESESSRSTNIRPVRFRCRHYSGPRCKHCGVGPYMRHPHRRCSFGALRCCRHCGVGPLLRRYR